MKFYIWFTWDTVHHHQGSVSDTEGSSHLRGEVNVARGVNQVDEETILTLFPLVRAGDKLNIFVT